MSYYIVMGAGGWRREVEAESPVAAAEQAIREDPPRTLGALIEVLRVADPADENMVYVCSERVLKNLGMWADKV